MAGRLSDNYPRPDWVRPKLSWAGLDGSWDFIFDDDDIGLQQRWHQSGLPAKTNQHVKRKITVPFAFQTEASGVSNKNAHAVVWYERKVETLSYRSSHQCLLRFGAVDYEATIWVDGNRVGQHVGGHTPFDIDITDQTIDKKEVRLTVRVFDSPTDKSQPRGKQYWKAKPESIFYTPSTGIWQHVWIESVPWHRIGDSSHGTILRADNIDSGELSAEISVVNHACGLKVKVYASLNQVPIAHKEAIVDDDNISRLSLSLRLTLAQQRSLSESFKQIRPLEDNACWRDGLALWSPECPNLYELEIVLLDRSDNILDKVYTTTGVRSLDWTKGDGTFRLNGDPLFQALVLDQGYWPDTGITAPTQDALKQDIVLAKAMGFNGCRKHQKVEDPAFMYWADKLGFLVWGEIASAFEYSKQYVNRFNQEWVEAVRRDINHPCIVAWTPVNETWGYPNLKDSDDQRNHVHSLYYMTKSIDPTRPVNDNCGWEHVRTDLTTFHDYSEADLLAQTCLTLKGILSPKADHDMFVGDMEHRTGAPVICTEFGGVNIALEVGEQAVDGAWGYTTATDASDLLDRLHKLMLAIVKGGNCCGFVYTQLTDIEQEVNGLYTFDRKGNLPAEQVKEIIDEARTVYLDLQKSSL